MSNKILLIYTGGTIGMKNDPETGVLMPVDFNNIYDEFPYLKYLGVNIEAMVFKAIDSSNVSPELWLRLAGIIQDNYDHFDGFVILHGTDTMSYSASALSFLLENLRKPVVFTGSQIPIGVMRTDGRENLIMAIEIAAAKNDDGTAKVPEVALYFQNRLYRANRTTKYSAEELDAFRSANYPALADVGVNIFYNDNYINRTTDQKRTLYISESLVPDVMVMRIFPGLTEKIFRSQLEVDGVKGIVLQTYGSGNAPTYGWFLTALEKTVLRGIAILNVTQCLSGSVSMIYETGLALKKVGVVGGRDITTEAAVTKMMYLLALDISHDEVIRRLGISLRGEITI